LVANDFAFSPLRFCHHCFGAEVGILLLERRDRFQAAKMRQWLDDQIIPAFAGAY
jgi:hypothetical protein